MRAGEGGKAPKQRPGTLSKLPTRLAFVLAACCVASCGSSNATQTGDAAVKDGASTLGTSDAGGSPADGGATTQVSTPLPPCPFIRGVSVNPYDSPEIVEISTAKTQEVTPGLLGVNSELTGVAMDWANVDYQSKTRAMNLGWVRYSGGTLSDAYDWTDGTFAWSASFPGGPWSTTCLLDPRNAACGAGWGTEHMYEMAQVINQNKTGKMQLPAWVSFASGARVATVVEVNVFTDTPERAGSLAKALTMAGVQPVLWELGNEVYDYTSRSVWAPPVGGYWAGQGFPTTTSSGGASGSDTPFPDGESYASRVAAFGRAIRAVVPTAHISIDVLDTDGTWTAGVASYTKSTAPGGNCEGSSETRPCDEAHFPVYFDTLSIHSYPCPFVPFPSRLEEACLNQKLYVVASSLAKQTALHPGCGNGDPEPTSGGTCTSWLSGYSPRIAYTEVNASIEGGDGAQIIVPQGSVRGSMFAALYLADFIARTASDSAPYVDRVGIQQLYGNWFALLNATREPGVRQALQYGPLDAGTANIDYGLFETIPGFAVQIVGGALKGAPTNLGVTVTWSGEAPTVEACEGNGVLAQNAAGVATGCASGVADIPAIRAYAWREGTTLSPAVYHTLFVNRGSAYASVQIEVDGAPINPKVPPIVTEISGGASAGADMLDNSLVAPDGSTTNAALVTSHSCSLPSACALGATCKRKGYYQIAPFSVARIDWNE
jgi:hypothetical protein